jgi:hypothetical protein
MRENEEKALEAGEISIGIMRDFPLIQIINWKEITKSEYNDFQNQTTS